MSRPKVQQENDALKYRYIKMKDDASSEQTTSLKEIVEFNRNDQKIEQMREDVEPYLEDVRKQAAKEQKI